MPILGVGFVVAIIGLAAARQRTAERNGREYSRERRLASGAHPRVTRGAKGGKLAGQAAPGEPSARDATSAPVPLGSDFWDAMPDSHSLREQPSRPGLPLDAYDAVDTEDLTLEWLARATQSPAALDANELDDPAEIPADSTSMISDASRRAAGFDQDDLEPTSDAERPRT